MYSETQVYEQKPNDFSPQVEVAATYVKFNDMLLLLQLAPNKREAGLWGVPAGKLEIDEAPMEGAKRELFEETGIDTNEDSFRSLGSLYIRKPDIDYIYHLFSINLDFQPPIVLSTEHVSYKWVSRGEAENLPLLQGAHRALEAYYRHSSKKNRSGASVNVYLVLRKNDTVLLHLRKNTGYCDGYYGLIAGHVEDGESAITAMIREAYEEAGIHINSIDLKMVHAMHRQTNRFNLDLFFDCEKWQGNISNREPEKCAALEFFSLQHLPSNIVDYVKIALGEFANHRPYSELGWS